MHQSTLAALADFLNASGWNYSVFLQMYETSISPDTDAEGLIARALGNEVKIDNLKNVSTAEVLTEIDDSLTYSGTDGAGPESEALRTPTFAELLKEVLSESADLARSASQIEQCTIEEGHPAYPVFWDFAFLFRLPKKALLLVGSSSD